MRVFLISICFLSAQLTVAAPKIISCTYELTTTSVLSSSSGEVRKITGGWKGIFDTDDFKKENPEYEYSETTGIHTDIVLRQRMEVTPTTISFHFCSSLLEHQIEKNCPDFKARRDVSRKTLKSLSAHENWIYKGTETGDCTIKDYNPGNLI